MKNSILIALLCIGSLATRAQKIIEKHIAFSPKDFVSMNFQISDSIRIMTWKKDEVYIRSSIDVNGSGALIAPSSRHQRSPRCTAFRSSRSPMRGVDSLTPRASAR